MGGNVPETQGNFRVVGEAREREGGVFQQRESKLEGGCKVSACAEGVKCSFNMFIR